MRIRPCPGRTDSIWVGSAPYVIETEGDADVRERIDELAAGGDQGHDHDQRYQGKNQRVFDHALAGLPETESDQHPTRKLHMVALMFENRFMS